MYLKLTLMLLLMLICCGVVSSQESTADATDSCDYGKLIKVIERLENRIDALEVENEQQRSDISDMRALLHQRGADQQDSETGGGLPDQTSALREQQDRTDDQTKGRIRKASPWLTVAFFATLQNPLHHLGHHQNVAFENVITNVGNAYDNHTGIFRAPVAGVYLFSTTVLTSVRNTTHYGFALNGRQLTTMFLNGKEKQGDSSSQTIVLQLQPGDDVSVQHLDSDKTLYGYGHSLISGILLSEPADGPAIVHVG